MWTAITQAIGGIFSGWVDLKKAKYKSEEARFMAQAKAEADWDQTALTQAQYSWKDEFILVVIYSPLIVAWFDPQRAQAWVDWVTQLPTWYQLFMAGILCASYGLRWFFKNKFSDGFKK